MFPDANAPAPVQPWVRAVSTRADKVQRDSTRTEHNAYNLAFSAKSSYELIDSRIANIDTFTTGLFSQGQYSDSVNSYAALSNMAKLYDYPDGNYHEYTAVVQRIPFAKYNELTVTASSDVHSYTTSGTATGINRDRPLRPMIMATIPTLPVIRANGSFEESGLGYAARWTVENFEPFLDYDIPGNLVPNSYGANYGQTVGYHPSFSPSILTTHSVDGYNGYSMKYTRQWLTEYMDAIRVYTMEVLPPPPGDFYLAPDVDQVEIILGWFYRAYTAGTDDNLNLNDNRLSFTADTAFILEGIRNLGY